MENILFILILLLATVAINCQESAIVGLPVPTGFAVIGHYGIHFPTRKTYFLSTNTTTGILQKEKCEAAGLSIVRLDTLSEAEYLLSVARKGMYDGFLGAFDDNGQWIWTSTNERINYNLPWMSGYSVATSGRCICLHWNGYHNQQACNLNMYRFYCQKIGI